MAGITPDEKSEFMRKINYKGKICTLLWATAIELLTDDTAWPAALGVYSAGSSSIMLPGARAIILWTT